MESPDSQTNLWKHFMKKKRKIDFAKGQKWLLKNS